ncbi:MAG: hypothetical protein H0V49_09215 [Nocardioidaceae bacterium]|nr:hypothetical protein [Nocardioidaceae bacterium]
MTQTLSRPITRVPHSSRGPQLPLPMAAAAAALWAVGVGLVCCVAVSVGAWFAADTGTFGGSIRVGALAWLVTLGAGLHLEGVTITVIPLGLTALTAWLLYRGGHWAGARSDVRSRRDAALGVLTSVGVFAAAVVAVQWATDSPGVSVGLWRSLAVSVALAGAFGGLGLIRGAGLAAQLLAPLPAVARGVLAGGCAGVAALVAASAALFTGAMVTHFSAAVSVAEGMRVGAVGAAIMAVVGVAVVPNAVLCAGSFIVGSGFSVGVGTSVAPGGVTLGALPAFPLFAALPSGDGAWWQQALVAIPLGAGAVAGLVTARRYPPPNDGWSGSAVPGACAGLLTGLGFGALTWLATGAIGPGRMQEVGPDVVVTTVVASVAALLGGAAAPVAARWLARR